MNHAQIERAELAALLDQVGPDVPTLCEGWNSADLAAHLVVRERRPDAALGILASPFERHGEKVRREYARKPYPELVELVRSGPPTLSAFGIGAVDRLANTMEYFIHHEDLRRGGSDDVAPRELDADMDDQLWDIVGRMSKLFLRKAPAGVTLVAPGGRSVIAKSSSPMVTVTGPVGELALFIYGRQASAQVEVVGPDLAVEAVRQARFGI